MYPTIKYRIFPIICPSFPLGAPIVVRIMPTIGKAIQYLNIAVKTEVLANRNNIILIDLNI